MVGVRVGQCKWINKSHLCMCVRNGRLFIKVVWCTLFLLIFPLRNVGNTVSDQMLSLTFQVLFLSGTNVRYGKEKSHK